MVHRMFTHFFLSLLQKHLLFANSAQTDSVFECFSLPFGFYISAGADVVLGGQHKLIVENPLRLVVQYGRRVQLDHLVVLHCEIVAGALQVSNLITPETQINK